ncbi:MAG TPA: competence/damage-inducible protein A [Tepidisphaeraceae bacterium]|nr:competence/damage-inducible protein A [Tepidisphaeraceae bacterium]
MNAIILSVGDELVLGQTVDTNSAWLSQQLAAVGCGVLAHATVADDQKFIEDAIRQAAPRCDVLLISGGLGPTEDDLTRQALASVMGRPLELSDEWLRELEKFFAMRNRPMPPANRIQAMIPRTAKMIFNTAGTAAGIEATLGAGRIFVMPGVPKEMKIMFQRDVLPHVRDASGGAVILSRTLHTFGLGESAIAEKLGDLMRRDRNPSVGTTVSGGIVSLRINARFGSRDQAATQLEQMVEQCRRALGSLIYGQDDQTLQQVVGDLLKSDPRKPTVATAESCTGGWLGKMITDVPGSSAYFAHGWITYANQAKEQLLAVPPELLRQHGAVSEPVVLAMAGGAKARANSTFALAISGIAGPDGGTPIKPVGTVCIALAHPGGADARTFLFPGDREFIRDRAAKMALTLLRYHLLDERPPF